MNFYTPIRILTKIVSVWDMLPKHKGQSLLLGRLLMYSCQDQANVVQLRNHFARPL